MSEFDPYVPLTEYFESIKPITIANPSGHYFYALTQSHRAADTLASRAMRELRSEWENPAAVHALIERLKAGEELPILWADVQCGHCGITLLTAVLRGSTITLTELRRHDDSRPWPKQLYGGEVTQCIIDPNAPYSVELDVPSGKMLVANHLSDFAPKLDQYNEPTPDEDHEWFSINFLLGRRHTSEWYAQHQYVELNCGDGSCNFYRDGNGFIVGYREDGDAVASVCTDFWGYGVMDLEVAISRGWKPEVRDHDIIECEPGRYRFTHQYHLAKAAQEAVWTYITRIP